MKILMSAYACEPNRGSEPGVGWHWALQAARSHEVWLVTSPLHRDAIERELTIRPIPQLHVVYHYLPLWRPKYYSGYLFGNLFYRLWQLTAIPFGRRLHRQVGFDIGHQVTYVSFRHPSFLAWLNIPFIWGPIGGGDPAPLRFYRVYGIAGSLREVLRALSVVVTRFDPMVRFTARKAVVILAVTPQTQSALPAFARAKTRIVPAIGVERPVFEMSLRVGRINEITLIAVGNLLYLKGLQLAIRAIAKVKHEHPQIKVSLTLIGDGPYRTVLEDISCSLGVADLVDFRGQLPITLVQALYRQHDALVFPSFTDSGGFVVLEAMAAGLPVICLDLAGPTLLVTNETGIRVPAFNPEQTVTGLADAILQLAQDEDLRRRMSEAATERVRSEYTWERKGEFIHQLYTQAARGEQ